MPRDQLKFVKELYTASTFTLVLVESGNKHEAGTKPMEHENILLVVD